MNKTVFALLRMFVLAAFVPAIAFSLVACEPEDGADGGTITPSVTPEVSVPDGYVNYFIEDLSFSRSAGEAKVAFQINVDWTMEVVGSPSWCRVEPASGAVGLHKVMVCVLENDTYEPRSVKIHLLCGTTKVAEIAVEQDCEYAVLLDRKDYSVSYESSIIDVEVKSNLDFEYTILDAAWVRASSDATRGLTTRNLSFEVDENDTRKAREAHIFFYNSSYAIADTLTLVQEGNPDAVPYKAIDLGLPSGILWASCNVGAESPEEYGDYFAWGETEPKSNYSSSNSVTSGLSISELESRGIIDADGNLTAAYDAATANWGENWRMPTMAEMNELLSECTWSWTTQNGIYGRKVTSPNGNSIFLPAAGGHYNTSLDFAGSYGLYWSATPGFYKNSQITYGFDFASGRCECACYGSPSHGFSVRPVSE